MTPRTEKGTTAEIRLLGQRISLKCSNADPDVTAEAIDLVSSRIDAAEKRANKVTMSPHQIVLLALLDLAEEYVHAKKRTAQYQAEMQARAQELLKTLPEGEAPAT